MRPEEAGPPEVEEALAEVPAPPPGFLEPLEIGEVRLRSRLVMAPMAGYTNLTFRRLVSAHGAGMVATEMVSSQALIRRHPKTFELMRIEARDRPVSVQLFGADPAVMGEAAAIAEEGGADVIDLNCGCPVRKITKTEAGSALLCHPERAAGIVSAMVRSVRKPVTVKMRTGWDTIGVGEAERFARAVEDAGAAAIAVHGRTRQAMFGGFVDLETISRVKRAVSIPVLGNGSILSPRDAFDMLERTGVDGLMIGRGAIGNPWIFSRLIHWFRTGELPPPPTPGERRAVALEHLAGLRETLGERLAVLHARKHLAAYTKGMRGGAAFRERVNQLESLEAVVAAVEVFFGEVLPDGAGREGAVPAAAERSDAA